MPNLIKIDNTYEYLTALELKLIKQMQAILVRYNRNASKALSNSLDSGIATKDYQGNGRLYWTLKLPDNLDGTPSHGGFVLDSKRRIKKKGPSRAAIEGLKKWIIQKGIPIGGGKLRTPMGKGPKKTEVVVVNGRKQARINYGEKMASAQAGSNDKDKQRTSFAFAIWYKIKKNQRIKANKTNFLKPYENIWTQKTFRKDLSAALKKDGITIIRTYNGVTNINKSAVSHIGLIKIKM